MARYYGRASTKNKTTGLGPVHVWPRLFTMDHVLPCTHIRRTSPYFYVRCSEEAGSPGGATPTAQAYDPRPLRLLAIYYT